jgi:hypothetical protein
MWDAADGVLIQRSSMPMAAVLISNAKTRSRYTSSQPVKAWAKQARCRLHTVGERRMFLASGREPWYIPFRSPYVEGITTKI